MPRQYESTKPTKPTKRTKGTKASAPQLDLAQQGVIRCPTRCGDVYRRDYFVMYLAKIAASIIVSIAAALLIQVLVNFRVEVQAEAWRLAPGFSHAAVLSVGVVLALVTAWEVGRRPFNRSRAAAAMGAYTVVCGLWQLLFANGAGVFVTATVLVALGYECSSLERGRPDCSSPSRTSRLPSTACTSRPASPSGRAEPCWRGRCSSPCGSQPS